MNKYLLSFFILTSSITQAQVPEDAIRYSFYPQNGTARNLSIGGAMGSLGGDINAIFVNPAGLGFFKTNELVLTPGFLLNKNKANYRETNSQNKKNSFGFGTSGFVTGFSNRHNPSVNTAISFAVTQTANFNNQIKYSGLNNYSSFSEQFAEEFAKSGLSINEVLQSNSPYPFTSAVALFTYLIDTLKVNGVYQVKAAPEYILDAGQALRQEMVKSTLGGITEVAIAVARNNNDKFYWGITIGLPLVNYSSSLEFREMDTSSNSSNHFNKFTYTDNFSTKGVGINGKIGIIYKPKEYIRLGLAIHTPSFMALTDKRSTTLSTQLENPIGNFETTSNLFTNNQEGKAQYSQSSAFKAIISGSYVFREVADVKKQKGFITADLEYVNHKGSKFGSANEEPTQTELNYYKALNNLVKADYKGNVNFRVGGEVKFNIIMGRLGFAYYGNPYKNAAYKATRMLLSGGLGYRNKGVFVDLTYVHSISKDVNFPYRLEDRANTFATLKEQRGNVVATVGFKF